MLQDGVMDSKRYGYMKPYENGYLYIYILVVLVGGFNPSDKYESNGSIIPFIMENKQCLKPPISTYILYIYMDISGLMNIPHIGNSPKF